MVFMMHKLAYSLFAFSILSMACVGCGGGVSSGVADAPETPAPELTPDERKSEAESARAARQ